MKFPRHILLCLSPLLVVAGCASSKIIDQREIVTEKMPRPGHVWVYDFAATPEEVPAASALAGRHSEHSKPQTAEQIATGRKVGAQLAAELVEQIRAIGMPAKRAVGGTKPRINDLVIRGYLLSIEEGSAAKRVAIGFGAGESELKVAAEEFQMTPEGLRKIGSDTTESGGSKAPGGVLGAAAFIASHTPVGLIVGTGLKAYAEDTGSSRIEGRVKATAKEIADVLKKRYQEQGWID